MTNTAKRDLSHVALSRDDAAERAIPSAPSGADSLQAAHRALEAALDKKALEPLLLDVRELCSYTDYILLVSARSDRQVKAVADGVEETMKKRGYQPLGIEGVGGGQWTLIDFGDVVIHVFYHPTREFYDLESLWNDAPRVPIDVPDDARISAEERY